jgi:hypothetical protein
MCSNDEGEGDLNKTLGVLAIGLLASGFVAVPAAGAANVVTYPLATQTTAAGVATYWLGDGGANLANATPYTVQTVVDDVVLGGEVTPDTKPGSVPPIPPELTEGDDKAPFGSGKVFFVGADGLPHWCAGTSVTSNYRNLVATAGHCAYDTQRHDAGLDKLVFVPVATPATLYVGKQVFTHDDFPAYDDYDRDYAFVNVHSGVTASPSGELTNAGRLGDNVGSQGVAWNQPLDSEVDVFGYDGLGTFKGRTGAAKAPSLNAEELVTVDSPDDSLGSSWLARYDNNSRMGYLNAVTISVAATRDRSFSPYFDGELANVYKAAASVWSGSVILPT